MERLTSVALVRDPRDDKSPLPAREEVHLWCFEGTESNHAARDVRRGGRRRLAR